MSDLPSEEMIEAGEEALRQKTDVYLDGSEVVHGDAVRDIWLAMESARPISLQTLAERIQELQGLEGHLHREALRIAEALRDRAATRPEITEALRVIDRERHQNGIDLLMAKIDLQNYIHKETGLSWDFLTGLYR